MSSFFIFEDWFGKSHGLFFALKVFLKIPSQKSAIR